MAHSITGPGYIGPDYAYRPSGPASYALLGGTGNGTQATLNFSTTLPSAPYSAGQVVCGNLRIAY